MNEHKFFICKHCGNLISTINNSGVPMVCCGEKMQEIVTNSTEAATEKHIPVVKCEGNVVTVEVGSIAHPMTEEHLIKWIYLKTDKGGMIKYLDSSSKPTAVFNLSDEKPLIVFAYCNLHGLWKNEL